MACVFIQVQCKPGTAYDVANALYEREFASEIYSTSGEFDLMLKVYIEGTEDVGKYINSKVGGIDSISRTFTTMTFKAF